MSQRYSVDTSSLIHAWRRAYPIDVFETLWTHLEKMIEEVCWPSVIQTLGSGV